MSGHCSCACISYTSTKYRCRIDIAIFGQYRIDIVSKLKSWYRVITNAAHYAGRSLVTDCNRDCWRTSNTVTTDNEFFLSIKDWHWPDAKMCNSLLHIFGSGQCQSLIDKFLCKNYMLLYNRNCNDWIYLFPVYTFGRILCFCGQCPCLAFIFSSSSSEVGDKHSIPTSDPI